MLLGVTGLDVLVRAGEDSIVRIIADVASTILLDLVGRDDREMAERVRFETEALERDVLDPSLLEGELDLAGVLVVANDRTGERVDPLVERLGICRHDDDVNSDAEVIKSQDVLCLNKHVLSFLLGCV